MIGGAIVSLLGRPGLEEIGILAGIAGLSGLVTVLMVQGWLEILEGPWLANAGVVALAVFASGATVAGLKALIGYPGLAVGALLFVFVGNPWSGIGSAPSCSRRPRASSASCCRPAPAASSCAAPHSSTAPAAAAT